MNSHPPENHYDIVPPVRSHCGRLMTMFSLCAFIIFIAIHYKGADQTAILSIFPLWLWTIILGFPALLAWVLFRTKAGLFLFAIWMGFAVFSADFIPALARTGKPAYQMPQSPGMKYWRIITLDCTGLEELPVGEISQLNADIIFLQGCNNPNLTMELAQNLFANHAQMRQLGNCAVIAANGQLGNAWGIPGVDGFIVDWIPIRSSLPIRLVDISLAPAKQVAANFLFPSNWKYHSGLRAKQRNQILNILNSLKVMGTKYGELPVIIGGNFNTSPTSPIFRALGKTFVDAYAERGSGYGATSPGNYPILRYERIFSTSPLAPSTSKTVKIGNAHHRAVIADMTKGE